MARIRAGNADVMGSPSYDGLMDAPTSGARHAGPASGASPPSDLRRVLSLAFPVVLAEIGWMSMGLVDTIMVGPLGPAAIGAVGLGSSLFVAIAIFGMGLLLGLDTLVSQAFGAGRRDECRRWLRHGLVLGALTAVPITAGAFAILKALPHAGLHPEVLGLARPYFSAVGWSLIPLLAYAAFRRYLQGIGRVRPVMFALVSANLVNACANWTLIYGHFGFPVMGTAGAAWATVVSRVYMAGVLLTAIHLDERAAGRSIADVIGPIEVERLRRLLRLGLPAALQVTLEVGVFAAATALAARLDPVALAAHQIALNVASVVYMVPLGFSSAGAVLVGHAVGARDVARAARVGWKTLGVVAAFMLGIAASLVLVPRVLLGVFTSNEPVLVLGSTLLFVAAIFQLFDGMQVVATGILRGIGDTRTAMVWNFAGHWMLGLPTGAYLCFHAGFGVIGLWIGLSIGLILVGAVLVSVWSRRIRALGAAAPRVLGQA